MGTDEHFSDCFIIGLISCVRFDVQHLAEKRSEIMEKIPISPQTLT